MELLHHVFSKFLLKGAAKDDILDLMEQFGLIAKFSPSKTDEKYFVPCQLTMPPDHLYRQAQTLVLFMFTLLLVLSLMACLHGLFLDSSGGVLRPVQLSPLPYIKMEHGSSLGGKLSMI